MAKTKQDYYNAGAADFYDGKERQTAGKSSKSWQEVAYDNGYDTAKRVRESADESARFAADVENEAHARSLETVGLRVPSAVAAAVAADPAGAEKHLKDEVAAMQKANQEVKTLGKGTMPRIAIQHIQQLQTIADTSSDPKRAARCARKVQALVEKWGRKVHA